MPDRYDRCPSAVASRLRLMVAATLAMPFVALTHARAEPTRAEATERERTILAQAPETPEPAAVEPDDELDAAASATAIAPPSDVEVIRIKGRGVSAIETDVPASVTQFDASAIEALGAQNISDLAKVTPNVEIRTAGATQASFFIRGVGLQDFSSNAAGAVAIYQDDVALNAPAIQLGQLFDVENVEVLRGPQGTGPGRNASAGAIKAYSRKPTGEFQAQLRSSIGAYGASSPNTRNALLQDYEGAFEVPLIPEILSTRVAFRLRHGDPYKTNGCGGVDPSLKERLNDRSFGPSRRLQDAVTFCGEQPTNRSNITDEPAPPGIRDNFKFSPMPSDLPKQVGDLGSWAARGQVRFQPPGTEMDWLINAHGSRLDQQQQLGQSIGTGAVVGGENRLGGTDDAGYRDPDITAEIEDLQARGLSLEEAVDEVGKNLAEDRPLDRRAFRGDYNLVGQTKLDSWGGFIRGDMPLGPVNFTTISAYERYVRSRPADQDFSPNLLFEAPVNDDDAWQFSQEFRFYGELPDLPFRWQAGGYYLMEELDANIVQQARALGNIVTLPREYTQDTWSFAFYGGFSWDFLDDFTLEGGVRYNWERKRFDFTRSELNQNGQETFSGSTLAAKTWDEPTGTISLNYRFREDVTAYWKYSRGFKAGHFNASANQLRDASEPARPEFIDAFEMGLRGRWWEGRLAMGGAFFYYKYVDYQVFIFETAPASPPVLEIINANDAEVYGAELDVRLEPISGFVDELWDGLVLTTRFGWLESQFLDFTNQVVRQTVTGTSIFIPVDYSDNQLINSPRFKVSGSAEWTFDLGRWGSIIPRYDFAWSDDVYFDPNEGRGSIGADGQEFLPDNTIGQAAFVLHNLRLSYRTPDGNIELAGWVRNLNDQVYKSYAFDANEIARTTIYFVGPPRTFGLDLSISW